jgi:hypothetical protein
MLQKNKTNPRMGGLLVMFFVGLVTYFLALLFMKSTDNQPPPAYKINMGYKASYQRYSLNFIATNDSPAYRYITYTHAWMGSFDEINWVYLDSAYIGKYRLNDFW